MGITAITIENFKGIQSPVRIEFKPITLLFGPNSAGKSTIIQALQYMREILARGNVNPDKTIAGGKAVDLGGFKTLVHNNDLRLQVKLKLDLNLDDIDLSDYLLENQNTEKDEKTSDWEYIVNECLSQVKSAFVECSIGWDFEDETPVVTSYTVGINEEVFAEISRQTTSHLPCRLTIFPHDISRNYLSDRRIEKGYMKEEDEVYNNYLLSPVSEESEWELLEKYDAEKERIDKEQEDFYNIPNFLHAAGLFLDQDSTIPDWNKLFKYIDPFWDDSEFYEHLLHINILSALILGPGKILIEELAKTKYLGPIRDLPSRNHIPSLSPDYSRWANGLAAWDILYSAKDEIIEELNDWLRSEDKLQIGYEVERKTYKELDTNSELWFSLMRGSYLDEEMNLRNEFILLPEKTRLCLKDYESGIEVSPQDIGIGISQILPVVVITLESNAGIVSIEQPELHVHPAIQVALGDLFISQIFDKEITFLLETHSEHLMLRLLRRIRETGDQELPPGKYPLHAEQLAVYFMEQGPSGIATTCIRINEEGDFIDKWPKGFFNERMKELF